MKIVRIGPVDYRVKTVKKLKGENGRLWGEIRYAPSCIRLVERLGPQARRVTLWHEILHGILTQGDVSEHNERAINILAHGIVGVLLDNEWIREAE